jgi:ABC-type Fe3+-siderophore transport system permease subunit
MIKGKLFRAANIYLLMAGLLSAALLFAPLAYASNYSSKIHASIYGTWVFLDHDMGAGMDDIRHRYLLQLPLHWPYALMGAALAVLLVMLAFYNRDGEQKKKWGRFLLIGVMVQIGFGVLLRVFALNHVGDSNFESSLESGFQREFLLHFFVLYFVWRFLRRLQIEKYKRQKKEFAGFE